MAIIHKLSLGQKFFIITAVIICGLLFYANSLAFNLFSATPVAYNTIAFTAIAAAVTLTIVNLILIFQEKNELNRSKNFKMPVVIKAESKKLSSPVAVLPVSAPHKNTKFEAHNFAESISKQDRPTKQAKANHSKLICPACKKEFKMPPSLGELMVNYGPRNASDLIKNCSNCGATFFLKTKSPKERKVAQKLPR